MSNWSGKTASERGESEETAPCYYAIAGNHIILMAAGSESCREMAVYLAESGCIPENSSAGGEYVPDSIMISGRGKSEYVYRIEAGIIPGKLIELQETYLPKMAVKKRSEEEIKGIFRQQLSNGEIGDGSKRHWR